MELRIQQYQMVQSSREAVFNYCETIAAKDFTRIFDNDKKSGIIYLLSHCADTYLFWLGEFAMKKEIKYSHDYTANSIKDISALFKKVDAVVFEFLNKFRDNDLKIEGYVSRLKKNCFETVISLFTHVITHEFHHKGQIMRLSREMGYSPPDTDVIRH